MGHDYVERSWAGANDFRLSAHEMGMFAVGGMCLDAGVWHWTD